MSGLDPQDPLIGFFVFILGSMVGSFLNVCIHRLPQGESIVRPGSHCPSCHKSIAWYDNIPLASFIMLRAKCRACSARIPTRYFAVELLNGLIWLILWFHSGLSPQFLGGVILFSILLAVTFTDLETGLIPDKLNLAGALAGLALSALFPEIQNRTLWYQGLLASFLGILAGGGVLYLIGMIGDWIFKKETMGGGDIKLLAMMGAFLGVPKILFVFLLAPFPAAPVALTLKLTRKAETIPFGPYLALTGACFYVAGDPIMAWILKYYGV